MARTKSSARWLREHFTDEYVKRAQREGYRSRAVYKLLEIQEKYNILRPGQTVVDLGAAPGGWSQLVAQRIGDRGSVIALDVLPIAPLPGVMSLTGDFRQTETLEALQAVLQGRPVDLVIADMAPNITGVRAVDQPRGLYLAELALDFAQQSLRPGGDFLTKAFQGEGFDTFLRTTRAAFANVTVCKPKASRARSAEQYVLARNYRGSEGLKIP